MPHKLYADATGHIDDEHRALRAIEWGVGRSWTWIISDIQLVYSRCRSRGWVAMMPGHWDQRRPQSYKLTKAGREALEAYDVRSALEQL